VLVGCSIFDPEEAIPGFVSVKSSGFDIAPNQGTARNQVTEHWFSINDNILGSYDQPCVVPVLENGTTRLRVQAGIKNNGVGTTRIRYPFYQPYDTVIHVVPGETIDVTPVYEYFSNLNFDISRNFESGNFLVSHGSNEGISESTTNQDVVFEGNRCGALILEEGTDYLLVKDINTLTLDAGNTIFLEMNYSCNNSFVLGFYVTTGGIAKKTPIITITPTTSASFAPTWNKIYIDLGALALGNPNASGHELYIECVQNEANSPRIYLDNLKIVRWD
jgi:hypothetical protein